MPRSWQKTSTERVKRFKNRQREDSLKTMIDRQRRAIRRAWGEDHDERDQEEDPD